MKEGEEGGRKEVKGRQGEKKRGKRGGSEEREEEQSRWKFAKYTSFKLQCYF